MLRPGVAESRDLAIDRRGERAHSVGPSICMDRVTPGRRLWIRMSVPAASRSKACMPWSLLRSMATDFLPRLKTWKLIESPWRKADPMWRASSPPSVRSSLTTSAPRSARIAPANGPASTCPSSSTRMFCSVFPMGAFPGPFRFDTGPGLCLHRGWRSLACAHRYGKYNIFISGSFVAERAHARLVVGPAGAHLYPYFQEGLGVELFFQFLARLGADALEALAFVADDHHLVAVALDHDGGGDLHQALVLPTELLTEPVDEHRRGVGQFVAGEAK